jgi:hypothetical protein
MKMQKLLPTLSLSLLLIAGLVVLPGCDNSGSNGPETTTYTADLGAPLVSRSFDDCRRNRYVRVP